MMVISKKCKIDSAALWLPLDKISLIEGFDYEYYSQGHTVTSEFEFEGNYNRSFRHFVNGSALWYKLKVASEYGGRKMQKGLEFILPSKILGKKYFDGINKDTIRDVFGIINSAANWFSISGDSFFNHGRFSDVDFCNDVIANDNQHKKYIYHLNELCKANGKNRFDLKKDSFFISDRKNGTISNPFGKTYRKGSHYLSNDKDHFLHNFEVKDKSNLYHLTRFEVTCKNQKFLRKFAKVDSSRVKDVLNFSQNTVKNIFKQHFGSYVVGTDTAESRIISELKPTEKIMLSRIHNYILNTFGSNKLLSSSEIEQLTLKLSFDDIRFLDNRAASDLKRKYKRLATEFYSLDSSQKNRELELFEFML